MQDSGTVPVVYLPAEPQWSRLVRGEDPGVEWGGWFLLVALGGTLLFGLGCLVCLSGYNLKTEDGVSSVTRNGRVVWQRGTAIRAERFEDEAAVRAVTEAAFGRPAPRRTWWTGCGRPGRC